MNSFSKLSFYLKHHLSQLKNRPLLVDKRPWAAYSLPMKSTTISIVQGTDGRVGLKFSNPLALQDALQLYFTGALALLRSYTPALPHAPRTPTPEQLEEQRNAIGEIYDLFNAGASHVLDTYAPELSLHPDLTTESIFEAELKVLSEKYNVPQDTIKEYAAKTRAAIKAKVPQ